MSGILEITVKTKCAESGSLGRRYIDPGHKEGPEESWGTLCNETQNRAGGRPQTHASKGELWTSSLTLTLFGWRRLVGETESQARGTRRERRKQVSGARGVRGEAAGRKEGAGGKRRPHRCGRRRRCGSSSWAAGLRAPASPLLAVPGLAAAGATL